MVDFPSSATFLSPAEQQYILDSRNAPGEEEHFEPRHIWAAVTDWQVYVFIVIGLGFVAPRKYICSSTEGDLGELTAGLFAVYGITFFSPYVLGVL